MVSITPRPLFTPRKDTVLIVQEAGCRSGHVRKILPPPGFDPWTAQLVANHLKRYCLFFMGMLACTNLQPYSDVIPTIHFCACIPCFCISFGGLEVAGCPLVPKFAGPNPAEAVGFLRAKKSSACLPSEGK